MRMLEKVSRLPVDFERIGTVEPIEIEQITHLAKCSTNNYISPECLMRSPGAADQQMSWMNSVSWRRFRHSTMGTTAEYSRAASSLMGCSAVALESSTSATAYVLS